MTRTARAWVRLLLVAACASGTSVALAAQAPVQKKPAATAPASPAGSAGAPRAVTPPQKTPAPPAVSQKAPAPPQKAPAPQKAAAPAAKTPARAAAPQPATPPAAPPPPGVERPAATETFAYKPEGRRDPFLSLVNRAALSDRPNMKKPEGLGGLSWDEITLRGIFQGRKGPVALVQAPDTRTYQVRVGDRLYDAIVKSITPDSLVVLQEVNDPLSLQKQRERRKTLRVAEEVK